MNAAERLYYLGVNLPDIKLHRLFDNQEITLWGDQRTLTNRSSPDVPPCPLRPPLFFNGACGTEFLSSRTYWQVKIRASVRGPVPDGYILCEFGVASPHALASSHIVVTPNYDKAATVKLLLDDDQLVATFVVNRSHRYDRVMADFNPGEEIEIDVTFGVFLDVSNGRLTIFNVTTNREMYILEWDEKGEFLPVVNCVNTRMRTGRDVCMSVESGSSIVLTRELINSFIQRQCAWKRGPGAC